MKSVRWFSVSRTLLQQQTLAQKIRTAKPNQNTFTFSQATKVYFNWLFSNTKTNLKKYEESLIKSVILPQSSQLTVSNVTGLHQIHLENPTASIKTPTLLVHGHAASGIFFHRNFNQLSSGIQNLYTIDMPDIGLSEYKPLDRRELKAIEVDLKLKKLDKEHEAYKISQNTIQNRTTAHKVIDYYIESIEKWRIQNNIEKMNIVAHSFGGYLLFNYCLKYPQNVAKLIMCSPAGVEKSIYSINNDITSGIINYSDPTSPTYDRKIFVPKFIARYGFGITKMLGPFGVKLISNYLSLRYSRGSTNDDQIKVLMLYTIFLFYQSSNSYKNLKYLLNDKILAIDPVLDHVKELKVPVMFMYGQFDWMNASAGYNASKGCSDGVFSTVENAGHNVFLDNSNSFDELVLKFLKE